MAIAKEQLRQIIYPFCTVNTTFNVFAINAKHKIGISNRCKRIKISAVAYYTHSIETNIICNAICPERT